MNQKGITMATVVVMIIIMIIIATVSIVAGNKIILNSNAYKEEQELESVKAAVLRKKTEVNMAGTLVPIGEPYVGIIDPIIKSDATETIVATGWYLLDDEALASLGIHDASSSFLAHYDYEVVLSTKDGDYIEEYMVVEFLHDLIDANTKKGIELKNTSGDPMVRNEEGNEIFGSGWYLVTKEDFPENIASYINHDYLFQYDRAEYEQVTSGFDYLNITVE